MFDYLSNLTYGLVVFALVVAVGTIVLFNFAKTGACDEFGTAYPNFNESIGKCENSTYGGAQTITRDTYVTTNYLQSKLGSGSGGLASWTGSVVAIAVGLLFLGAFMLKGKKGKY